MRKYADIQVTGSIRATKGPFHVASSQSDIEEVEPGAVIVVRNNDGTITSGDLYENSTFNVGSDQTISTNVRSFRGADTVLFTVTANAILNTAYGIGRAFGSQDWVPGGFQNGLVTLDNFRERGGKSPTQLNFRGRTTNEWWAQCRFVVTYTDGTVVETTSNVGNAATYHSVIFNQDQSRELESIVLDLTGINGGNPGIHDFNLFYPGVVGNGLWYKTQNETYARIGS